MRRSRAWLWAVTAAAAGLAAQAPDRKGVIHGVVVDDRGAPVTAARVGLATTSARAAPSTLTDDDGVFRLDQLQPGEYMIGANKRGHVDVVFGQRRRSVPGTIIPVRAGDARIIRLVLPRGGVISGTVRDRRGVPLPGIWVRAVSPRATPYWPGVGSARSDSQGRFRLWESPAGPVMITATTEFRSHEGLTLSDSTGRQQPVVFRDVFHPGVPSPSDAAVVSIQPGQEVSGIDITMAPVPAGRVEGTIVHSSPVRLQNGSVTLLDGSRAWGRSEPRATPDSEGRFAFDRVPAGRYTLTFQARSMAAPMEPQRSETWWAHTDVMVTAGETATARLDVSEGARVSGRFETPAATALPLDKIWMRLDTPAGPFARTDRGGYGEQRRGAAFAIAGVPPGPLGLTVNAPPPWWLLAALLGDRDILDAPIDLVSGDAIENLRVVMTDAVSAIEGIVAGADAQPQSDLDVVVFPSDRRLWSGGARRIRMVQPDLDGRFHVNELPPGDYLIAVNLDTALEPAIRSDDLDRLVAGARPVRVQLGGVAKIALTLVR